jgi:hypothetical protein
MLSSRALRVLTVVVIPLGTLLGVGGQYVHARGKPEAETQSATPTSPDASDAEVHGGLVGGASSAAEPSSVKPDKAARDSGTPASPKEAKDAAEDGAGKQALKENGEDKTIRVLMVGNSYTMHHSLHVMLQRLAAHVEGGPRMIVDAVAHGGYSLSNHLRTGQALQRIRAGHYTHVVLQGHSMSAVDHPDKLIADAKRFKQAIDAAEGQTVFYATWARSPEVRLYRTHKSVRSFAQMSMLVSSTYFELSSLLNAGLAPVGSAFERALIEHPKLTLWGSDGSHPSLAGSYMAACVLYGAITGIDPNLTDYIPNGMKADDAVLVRVVAARSLAAARSAVNTEVTTAGPFLGPT